ncbi:hypothetical protein E4U41_003521, partial [Claviceps citrina]
MATFYDDGDDGDETPMRQGGQDAPEVVNRLSDTVTRSSIDGKLRRQYSMRSAQCPFGPAADLDTDKEVVTWFPMDSGIATPPPPHPSSPARQVISPVTMTGPGPQTTCRPGTTDDQPMASFANAAGGAPDPASEKSRDRDKSEEGVGCAKTKRKIMGMTRRVFLVVSTVLGLVVLVAAVGGGVGGALASRNKNSASATPRDIKFLNNETWTRDGLLAFQAFARPSFSGVSSPIFTGDGTRDFAVDLQFDAHSFAWVPNLHRCCVNLCVNGTRAGRMGFVCGRKMERVTMRAVARVAAQGIGQDGSGRAPQAVEAFTVERGDDVEGARVWACYWDEEALGKMGLRELDLLSVYGGLSAEEQAQIGLWSESFSTAVSRLETNYSGLDYLPGLARLPDTTTERHDLTGYWGAARDRIPDSAHDLFEADPDPDAGADAEP